MPATASSELETAVRSSRTPACASRTPVRAPVADPHGGRDGRARARPGLSHAFLNLRPPIGLLGLDRRVCVRPALDPPGRDRAIGWRLEPRRLPPKRALATGATATRAHHARRRDDPADAQVVGLLALWRLRGPRPGLDPQPTRVIGTAVSSLGDAVVGCLGFGHRAGAKLYEVLIERFADDADRAFRAVAIGAP